MQVHVWCAWYMYLPSHSFGQMTCQCYSLKILKELKGTRTSYCGGGVMLIMPKFICGLEMLQVDFQFPHDFFYDLLSQFNVC